MTDEISLAIIIPTFNEVHNVEKLINSINKEVSYALKIIIVDDNSPDGTSGLVHNITKHKKNVFLIKRKAKGGRGSAVITGFKFAMKFKPDYFIEMDADFSHRTQDLPHLLLSAIQNKHDIVIGSRYLNKSKIYNWSVKRKIFSRLANFYAKSVLQVPISDYTNGFRIYSNKAIAFLMTKKIESVGFIVLSETAYLLNKANFKFGEIPIIFVNRKRGSSNLSLNEIKNAFLGIWRIRFPKTNN